jgi:hypothetical protein
MLNHLQQGAGDFNWAVWMARDLLAHRNPYDRPTQLYPLPAALFALPIAWLPRSVAGGIFYGVSSGLMAFGLTARGYDKLFVFLAYPFWAGTLTAQWTPLLFAAASFPVLLPAVLAKPQIGFPIAVTRLSKIGVAACAMVLGLSFIVLPRWPWLWAAHFGEYQRFIPLLVFPGPLLLIALVRYWDCDAIFLLLMGAMPQRWFYDSLVLWLIPKTRKQILLTALASWAAGIWRWYHIPHTFIEVGRVSVICAYLPMLAVVLSRSLEGASQAKSRRLSGSLR